MKNFAKNWQRHPSKQDGKKIDHKRKTPKMYAPGEVVDARYIVGKNGEFRRINENS